MIEQRQPCGRLCDIEWCSIICFERRGQIYDRVHKEWLKDENGKPLIRKVQKICDWTPKDIEISTQKKGGTQ